MAIVFSTLLGLPTRFDAQHAVASKMQEALRSESEFADAVFRLDTCPPLEPDGIKGSFLFIELKHALVLELRFYVRSVPHTFSIESELLPFRTRMWRIIAASVSFLTFPAWFIFLQRNPVVAVVGIALTYAVLHAAGDFFTRRSHRRHEAELNRCLSYVFEDHRPQIECLLGVAA